MLPSSRLRFRRPSGCLRPSASCRGRARRSAARRARAALPADCGRPSRSLTDTKRMMPSGSTMKVARSATPSSLSRMPSAVRQLALDVGQHRERQAFEVGMVLAPGEVDELAVGRDAVDHARRGRRTRALSLPKPAISVGQTKVKSFGQKNTTFHLPASVSLVAGVKAVFGSVPLTAVREKAGNLSPTVSIRVLLFVRSAKLAMRRKWPYMPYRSNK